MQATLGGAEKIAVIYDYEETVRAEALDIHGTHLGEVRKRTRWMRRTNLLGLDQVGLRGTYVPLFRRSFWVRVGNSAGPKQP
jgi:hypothetical protein